jgi:hypothetical protein
MQAKKTPEDARVTVKDALALTFHIAFTQWLGYKE